MNEDQLLDYTDYPSVRQDLRDKVLKAVQEAPAVENEQFTLRVVNPRFSGKDRHSLKDQKGAILGGQSLSDKLVGNYELTDNLSGKVVGRTNQKRIMNVPYLTDRGTYIRNGTEYIISKQFRLVPGVYTRNTDDGNIESQFNAKPRTGSSFRVFMQPSSGHFFMKYKNRKLPLYPILRAMGVPEDAIAKRWGQDLTKKNKALERSPYAINFLKQFREQRDETREELLSLRGQQKEAADLDYGPEFQSKVIGEFSKAELDPRVTRRTLGKEFRNATPDAIMAATSKILDVGRGKADTDSRDSLAYQDVYDISDFLSEKIRNDQGGALSKVLWKLTGRGQDMKKIPPSLMDAHVKHLFTAAGVAQAVEEINPSDIYDQNVRISRLGEGALPSVDVAPKESRNVQPSYLGYIDPVVAPECYSADMEVFTSSGWKTWPSVTQHDSLACMVDGRLEYNRPEKIVRHQVNEVMYGSSHKSAAFLVTGNHRMWVRPEPHAKKGFDPEYRIETALDMQGKNRKVLIGGHLPLHTECLDGFVLPDIPIKSNATRTYENTIPMSLWAPFMGWFLAEGSVTYDVEKSLYLVQVSQSEEANPENWVEIEDLLSKLPFNFRPSSDRKGFYMPGKQLAEYLRQFGKCNDKYVPDNIKKASESSRESFIEAFSKGDGRRHGDGRLASLCTTSERLAEDLHQMLFELGESSIITFEPDDREDRYFGCWVVYRHKRTERMIHAKIPGTNRSHHFTQEYNGTVYCASVPGGLLYVRRPNNSGMWCGNSMRIGLDMRLARNVRRGPDKQLYTQLINAKSGQKEWVGVRQATEMNIGMPGSADSRDDFVPTMSRGRDMQYVHKKDLDYMLPDGDEMFSDTANLVPLKSGVKGMRLLMGNKFARQALPLVKREAPLVQTLSAGGKSEEERLGKYMGAVKASKPGIIKSVYKDHIKIGYADGTEDTIDLYENFPYSRKTFIRNMAQVKAGQKVEEGEILATSNYTDPKGTTALGTNLRVAYLNYDGKVFEDAIVISASAAKKMTSEHMYTNKFEKDKDLDTSKTKFMAIYPAKFSKAQLKTMTDEGIVKPGTVVQYGDPLVLAVREREPTPQTMGRRTRSDETLTWAHEFPAVVTDASPSKKGYNINVRANTPMEEGDKLAGRFGNKGVISEVINDDDMLRDAKGRPIDVFFSPLGIHSRTNPAQKAEAILGKVAEKTGKPYVLPGFMEEDMKKFALREAQKNNIDANEDLVDPRTGKTIPKILTGMTYVYKLQHTAEGKGKARGTSRYTAEDQPARGGKEGAKHLGDMEIQSLMAHGADQVLKDLKVIKGQKNDEFWRQLKLGQTPTQPGTPMVYQKFKSLIRAAGINLHEDRHKDNVFAMTNAQAEELTGNREIKNASTYGAKNLRPIPGGLFDPEATGSMGRGDRWGFIKLPKPMPNPIMAEPIRRILGMKQKEFDALIGGESEVEGLTGSDAVSHMLGKVDMQSLKARTLDQIKHGVKSKRDDAVKLFRYVDAMEKHGVKPDDFMMNRVPVLPPMYRPITRQSDMTMVADPNYLYKSMLESIEDYKDSDGMPKEDRAEAWGEVWKSYKTLVGTTDPDQEQLQQKNVGGILKQIFGKGSPKFGFVQRRVIGTNIDVSGLGVVTPNPSLKLNQIGMPEKLAWNLYGDFTVREMVQKGYPATEAVKGVENHSPAAYQALKSVIKKRPVLVNRAPTLHKFSNMAFDPVLTKGKTIQVSPSVVGPFGMDFDGNCVDFGSVIKLKISKSMLEDSEWLEYIMDNLRNEGGYR